MNFRQNAGQIEKQLLDTKAIQYLRGTKVSRGVRAAISRCSRNPFPYLCGLIVVYRLSLDFIYLTLLSKHYEYAGFTVNLIPLNYISSLLALVLLTPMIAHINLNQQPSSMMITTLNYLYFIPLTSYCGCKGSDAWLLVCTLVYWVILMIIQIKLPVLRMNRCPLKHIEILYTLLTICSVIFVMYVSGRYADFRFTLNFLDVYDIRAEAASYQMPRIFDYLLSFMTVILTMLLLYWLQKKKYLVVVLLTIVYLFHFSISAQKSTFFFLFLSIGGYFLYRTWMMQWVSAFMIAGVAVSWLMAAPVPQSGTLIPMSLFVRRMQFLPAQITENFGEFFQSNPLNLLRDGIMRWFGFPNNYSTDVPHIIGEFRGHPLENANSGLLGDMFANLPVVLGVLLMPLLLILCFRLLDMTTKGISAKITASISIYFALSFLSGVWSTVLLSGGFLLVCFLLYIFPSNVDKE